MNLEFDDIIDIFNKRELNIKTNNYVVTDLDIILRSRLIAGINVEAPVSYIPDAFSFDSNYPTMRNIFVDLNDVPVNEILAFSLEKLGISNQITFKSAVDLFRFRGILRNNGVCIAIIAYNSEELPISDRMTLNELYTFNTSFFNINELLMQESLFSTEMRSGRMLDNRENYTRIRVIK